MAVLSEWGNYPEMYIWRFEAPQTHRGMRFTLELQELIRVGINDNELPASQLSGPAVGRSGEVQRGRVQLVTSVVTIGGLRDAPARPKTFNRKKGRDMVGKKFWTIYFFTTFAFILGGGYFPSWLACPQLNMPLS